VPPISSLGWMIRRGRGTGLLLVTAYIRTWASTTGNLASTSNTLAWNRICPAFMLHRNSGETGGQEVVIRLLGTKNPLRVLSFKGTYLTIALSEKMTWTDLASHLAIRL